MKLIPLMFAVMLSFQMTACQEEKHDIAEDLIAQDFHEIYKERGGLLIDIRTNQEVENGMITGAVQIDYYRKDFYKELSKIDRDKPVFIYCAAGGRSGQAKKEMMEMGFKEIYNLSGGYSSWLQAGYSTTK